MRTSLKFSKNLIWHHGSTSTKLLPLPESHQQPLPTLNSLNYDLILKSSWSFWAIFLLNKDFLDTHVRKWFSWFFLYLLLQIPHVIQLFIRKRYALNFCSSIYLCEWHNVSTKIILLKRNGYRGKVFHFSGDNHQHTNSYNHQIIKKSKSHSPELLSVTKVGSKSKWCC